MAGALRSLGRFDAAIVGGGVVGCATLRELVLRGVNAVLLERNRDLIDEASGRNTGIVCTGYDAPPGSMEQRCIREALPLIGPTLAALGLPARACGSLVVAWTAQEAAHLPAIVEENRRLDDAAYLLSADELRREEPALAGHAVAAAVIPGEVVVDPWLVPAAFAADALRNGGRVVRDCNVVGGRREGDEWVLQTSQGVLTAGVVVNCAGLAADSVEAIHRPPPFEMRPRRGEYVVFSKPRVPLLRRPIQPVPTPETKGVYVFASLHGNIVVGPTAIDQRERSRAVVYDASRERLMAVVLPSLAHHCHVVGVYAGLRPATQHRDYQLSAGDRWICAAGIRSTGLTASLGISRRLATMYCDMTGHTSTAASAVRGPVAGDVPADYRARGDGTVLLAGHAFRVTHPLSVWGMAASGDGP